MKCKTAIIFLLFSVVSFGQHPDDYLSYTTTKNWLKENQIKIIQARIRFANKKGKFRKKPVLFYTYSDSLGIVGNELGRRIIYHSEDHREICQTFSEGSDHCTEQFFSDDKLVMQKGIFLTYFHYNEAGKLKTKWVCSRSFGSNTGELHEYEYSLGKELQKIKITEVRCPCIDDYSKVYNQYPKVEFREEKLEYDENGNLKEVILSRGMNDRNLLPYRKLTYEYDFEHIPVKVLCMNMIEQEWKLESEVLFEYKL